MLGAVDPRDRIEIERIAADSVHGLRRKNNNAAAQNDARDGFGDPLERFRPRVDSFRRLQVPA